MRRGAAFTLLELLVVVAIIGLLASLLAPALGRARGRARQATCASNLKQLGLAMQMYADDNRDFLPCPTRWQGETNFCWFFVVDAYISRASSVSRLEMIKQDPVWSTFAPAARTNWYTIKMNRRLVEPSTPTATVTSFRNLRSIAVPSTTPVLLDGRCPDVALTDTSVGPQYFAAWELYAARRHNGAANILFADWHVELWQQGTPHSNGGWENNTTGLTWYGQ